MSLSAAAIAELDETSLGASEIFETEDTTDVASLVPVSELGRYLRCARLPYFKDVLGLAEPPSVELDVWRQVQSAVARQPARWVGRLGQHPVFRRVKTGPGQWRTRVRLASARLGLSGVVDLLFEGGYSLIPVHFIVTGSWPYGDVSVTGAPSSAITVMAAYAMLVSEAYAKPCCHGLLYVLPHEQVFAVRVTDETRRAVLRAVDAIRALRRSQRLPDARQPLSRCAECPFLPCCGDVDVPRRRAWLG